MRGHSSPIIAATHSDAPAPFIPRGPVASTN
jgi:hypothetical protein